MGEKVILRTFEVLTFVDLMIFSVLLLSVFAVSHQHLCLAFSGLSHPGVGPLRGLCFLLAARLHHPCSQDERSRTDHRPTYDSRGCSRVPAGKGTRQFKSVDRTLTVKFKQSHDTYIQIFLFMKVFFLHNTPTV